MAEVVLSGSQKRKPSIHDNLENEQRLAKRFDLLNIDRNGKRYVPVAARQHRRSDAKPRPRSSTNDEDLMRLEDTKDKVYIYDLDSELAELESDEEKPIFIPDIEKHLNKIPKQVLVSQEPRSLANNQLVLYGVPSSLTIPEEQDNVRKAIIEARERARDKQAHGDVPNIFELKPITNAEERAGIMNSSSSFKDVDAMDMD